MGDPVAALRLLAPHIMQIPVKDAVASETPGTWGEEAPVGSGDVDWRAFFEVQRDVRLSCDLMIEREAPGDRVDEIRRAVAQVSRFLGV